MAEIVLIGGMAHLKSIKSSDIIRMNDDEIITVNRIFANKRLMEVKVSNTEEANQAAEVLVKVINKARKNERNRTGSVSDVKMTAREVKTAFGGLSELPPNALKVFSK